jgi:hypothetical protein
VEKIERKGKPEQKFDVAFGINFSFSKSFKKASYADLDWMIRSHQHDSVRCTPTVERYVRLIEAI